MSDPGDKAREEFFTEAQEITEAFARNLLAIDAALKGGHDDPQLINEAFRAVHTLKGLAGLFGAHKMGALSHRLEDVLDDIRLGRRELTAHVLDVLFAAIDVYGKIMTVERRGLDEPVESADALIAQLDALSAKQPGPQAHSVEYELDPGLLAVLTEYEEHRLRTNIDQGLGLYRLRVQFELATIDRALEEIKDRARHHGEIVTYLPTGESASPDSIELDLLMASRSDLATLIGDLGADNVVIDEVPRRRNPAMPSLVPMITSAPEAGPLAQSEEAREMESGAIEPVGSLRAATQTVRVDIRKLDELMNIVGELAIVRGMFSRVSDRLRAEGQRKLASELVRLNRGFDRRLGELRSAILEVRMVPLGQVFERLARATRQLSREAGKEIRLVITGSETEIDKLIVEELSDPLMHMVRNAIDHGIEPVTEREKVGKPQAGTIALNAYQKGNHVMIEIEDDGVGVNERALLDKAVRLGRIAASEAVELGKHEILELMFAPGVSTREEVGDLSGRGVGMDVVKTNISKLGGVIDVQSEPGIGTKMTMTLPITLAIVNALLVKVSEQTYAVPLNGVSESIVFDPASVRSIDGREVMTLRGTTLPLCWLSRLFALPEPSTSPVRRYVVVAGLGARRLGLIVDSLLGQQDIVIKPLGPTLAGVRSFAGATELGDQRVGLVIDAAAIIEEVLKGLDPSQPRESARAGG